MNRWYVIKTKPKKETDVLNQLKRASYELFFPRMKGLTAPKPLFPSYLFIRTNFEDSSAFRMVSFTRGVNKILGGAEGPQSISDLIIETLKEKTRDGSLIEQELLFKEGDAVSIKRGLLKDLIGIIEKNMSESGRVRVLFKWLQGNMRAVLKYTDLAKAV